MKSFGIVILSIGILLAGLIWQGIIHFCPFTPLIFLFVGAMFLAGDDGKMPSKGSLIKTMAVIGLIDSIALTLAHYGLIPFVPKEEFLITHPPKFSELYFIPVPVSVFGALTYCLILSLLKKAKNLIVIIGIFGVAFSIRLMYSAIFLIPGEVCPFCILSALLMLGILILSEKKWMKVPGIFIYLFSFLMGTGWVIFDHFFWI